MRTSSPILWIQRGFVAFWVAILLSSLAFKVSARFLGWPDWGRFVISENRHLTPSPNLRELPAKEWGRAIEAWYNDQFAWRSRLIQFYRYLHVAILHSAIKEQEVPGKGQWIFRRGGSWAELEDYLGAFELTPAELARWVELFEGRKQWAEAHGAFYLEVITPVKAQIHPERLFPMISRHRGQGVREQVRAALQTSLARDDVLFITDVIEAITRENRRTYFYATDHHVNGYGAYVIFREMMTAAAERLGPMNMPPFYDDPPAAVREDREWGCYHCGQPGYERLSVHMPGMHPVRSSFISPGGPYPAVPLAFEMPGAHRTLVIGHDSFLRFPMFSWYHSDEEPVRIPIADGFDRVLSLLFTRFTTGRLNRVVAAERPSLIIEQFPEIKLTQEVYGYDETMRRAAAFGRGTPIEAADALALPPDTPLLARITIDDLTDATGEWTDMRNGKDVPEITVHLHSGTNRLDSAVTWPGARRAIFFPALPLGGHPLHVTLENASPATPPPAIHLRIPGAPISIPSPL